MAWRGKFGRSRGFYRAKFTSYRARGRRFYKAGGGSILFGAGGVAAGYLAPTLHPLQDAAMTMIAVLPGVLPKSVGIPWQLRRFASGYVVGRMARTIVPNVLGGISGSAGAVGYSNAV